MRSLSRFLLRHRRLRLVTLVSAPMLWLIVAYLGSLLSLLLTAFYSQDPLTGIVRKLGLGNFRTITNFHKYPVYKNVVLRSLGLAVSVTIIDLLIALPVAFYLAKLASPRIRRILSVAVTLPLWTSYLVKAYAWRTFVDPGAGLIKRVVGVTPGFGLTSTAVVLAYLWLPFAILPIYAGLERLPDSLLEASADLGGKTAMTIRKVIVPVLAPALVAASIFTFSLSLGDYLAVELVGGQGKAQLLGTIVKSNYNQNGSLAAAVSLIPVIIMLVYLFGARFTGALENL
jgi:putative spermidine/putrescine transport system permease protein